MRFGGPILYLIVQCFFFIGILLWVDSGASFSRLFARRTRRNIVKDQQARPEAEDVATEAERCRTSDDVLRVTGISKTYGKSKVVDNVSLSVSSGTIFALLGPNGAGKTTTFNVISQCPYLLMSIWLTQGCRRRCSPRWWRCTCRRRVDTQQSSTCSLLAGRVPTIYRHRLAAHSP